jgi:hypothetical protein
MTEDAAIAIDRTTLQSVYTCTHPGMALDRCTVDRAYPTWRTLGSYGPILHPALKTVPPQKGRHRNCEMLPCGHTGVALRGWSHLHRSPTDTPLSFLSRYRSALAELNSALTPRSTGWCVRKSYKQVDPLGWARRDAKQRVVAVAARSSPVWARRHRRGGSARQVVRVPLPGVGGA